MPDRIGALDGLRGCAAIFVFAYHLQIGFSHVLLLSRGYLMVDLFFMLSGFVLTRTADSRLAQGGGAVAFMATRMLRIWPVMALGVAVGAAATASAVPSGGWHLHTFRIMAQLIAASLLLLPYPWSHRSGALFPLNVPHWSLLLELSANVVHGLLLWRLPDKVLVVFVGACAVLMAICAHSIGWSTAGPFFLGWYYGPCRIGLDYGLGMLLARRWARQQPEGPRKGSELPWILPQALPLGATALLACLPLPAWLGDLLVVVLVFPGCLWIAASSTVPAQPALWMARLGALSYPLYALHGPIVERAARISRSPFCFALVVCTCLLLAALTAALFERGPWPRIRRNLVAGLVRRRAVRSGR